MYIANWHKKIMKGGMRKVGKIIDRKLSRRKFAHTDKYYMYKIESVLKNMRHKSSQIT